MAVPKKPLAKLQKANPSNQPAGAKVGSWLQNSGSDKTSTEAYESSGSSSSSESSSSDSDSDSEDETGRRANGGKGAKKQAPVRVDDDDDDEEGADDNDEDQPLEEVDREMVLPKVKGAMLDPSRKRRKAFIHRYMTVTPSNPPATNTPPLIASLLSTFGSVFDFEQADDIVSVLVSLVARDEAAESDARLKLLDKLIKWLSMEAEKVTVPGRIVAVATFSPYLVLCLQLLGATRRYRSSDAEPAPKESQDVFVSLAYIVDAIEARGGKGKENAKAEMIRSRAIVRLRTYLHQAPKEHPAMLKCLLTKTVSLPIRLSCLIAHVADVTSIHEKAAAKAGKEKPSVVVAESEAIVSFYSTNVLGSKTVVPRYVSTAWSSVLPLVVSEQAMKEKLLPQAERMLLRSPEVALELTADLLKSSRSDISSLLPAKLLTPTLSAAKSTNADTRAKSVVLLRALVANCSEDAVQAKMATEILSLPKTGKTSSPEHRAILFTMTSELRPSKDVSPTVVDTLVPLITKEANEPALAALCGALVPHLAFCLSEDIPVASTTATALAKELMSSKPPTKRAVCDAVGEAIWRSQTAEGAKIGSEGDKLVSALVPSLVANMQSASANPPVNPQGYLEGYVASALAFGPLKSVSGAPKLVNDPAVAGLAVVSPKPSFLLSEKAYTKLASAADERWMLRALQGMVETWSGKAPGSSVRLAIGAAMLHLLLDATSGSVRREALQALVSMLSKQSKLVTQIMRESITSWLQSQDTRRVAAKTAVSEDSAGDFSAKAQKIGHVLAVLFAPPSASKDKEAESAALADRAVDFLVLAHHPSISEEAQVSWISLVQHAGLDPEAVVAERQEQVLKVIWDNAGLPPKDAGFAAAAYRAITTLSFVCPAVYMSVFIQTGREDLDPANLDFIREEERGIWATPADQLYVDVLAKNTKSVAENKNRKDYADHKWDQEVRASLAAKKAASGAAGGAAKLSKADQALVDAQKAKEAEVRQRIADVQARLRRGTELVAALIASNGATAQREAGNLAKAMLSTVFGRGSFLVDEETRAFEVFLMFASLMAPKLGEYRRLTAAAILRSHQSPLVPADYDAEPVGDLVTRLLHQLNFVSSQTALDPTTYSLVSILLTQIAQGGGVGCESPQTEQAQEQLTLVVNIIAACCGEFGDEAYPVLQTIKDLTHIIATYPRLAKDGTSALVDLGAAIKDVAPPAEIRELVLGTLSKDSNVRNAALQALQPVDITELDYSEELWIAMHDDDEQNAALASHLWEDNGLDIPETYLSSLLNNLDHDSAAVRLSTASALSEAAQLHPTQIVPTLDGLKAIYAEKAKLLMPEYDRFGMVIPETMNRADPFPARIAIAMAFTKMAPLVPDDQIAPMFDFLVGQEALGDRHGEVRRTMLNAGTAIIDIHGGKAINELMKTFEDYLAKASGGKSSETEDYIKEAAVILFGRLAGHLDAKDPRVPKVVDRLIQALNTPSELVQSAVADCLPPLVQGMSEEQVEYLVDQLFSTLTTGAKYASRRGAAYGLAGIVKGRGLVSLKEYDLMDKLKEAAEDKAAYQSRQGAVFAFETFSATLGRIFEPYIISIVPLLLALFGDGNTDVREATQDAAKVIMSKISGHCVKLMLPNLLDALEEKQWRTKKGAIELLGAMAFCAPRQLSLSLPTIIPHLTGVINDSHAQVKSAANTSLKRFGEVLDNPEIKGMQSTLMKALADPTAKTNTALSALLKTSFEHYLDAPSLALVMPIIDRGLKQRSSETKRKAAQIVGNMASLTESRDLVPYLHELMPLVHTVLVDPVPEARATAAKSLGTLVERLGEANFPDLVNQLLTTLRSDTSGVDRQGAAQGLSEVLSGLGLERLEGMLPEILNSTSSPKAYVREGFISLLVYLPTTFGHRFAPHLGRVIPPILNGLADESEFVREASMRAGKMIIANYSAKAIDLLLPELEKGMLDPSWRIRQSSISLTGELLYRVTGISGKVELEEDENPAQTADTARKALLEALGQDRRDRVLATLYIVRQDTVGIVRQASIHIWKALVQNTPKTTREILPVLMQLIMSLLGSEEEEQQETASRTLGELCRKNGDRIFGEIIPILQKAITSQDVRTKEGACLAFADVMAASNKDVMRDHENVIISAIRNALVDSEPSVRTAAARTFDTMQHYMGPKAVDQTIPTLLEAMRNPGEASETALQALQEVMSVRANSVFPVLIPTLTAQPITAFNARALGALVRVAGAALNKRLDTVLGALVKSLEEEQDDETKQELLGAIESLLAAVSDDDGIYQLQMLLFGWAKDHNATRRATTFTVFSTLCQVNSSDMSDYRSDWVRILVTSFDDPNEVVVAAAWEALEHFVKTVEKDELEDLVVPLRRAIESTGAPGKTVPGYSRPKGVQSIVPILLAGVLSGTQEQREQAALGIGELVQRTSEAAIKPYIIQLTGPLIRVISGQAIAPQIKVAILSTLTVLLEEVPLLVKPFHPQLTRTFIKSASDPAALSVRNRAAAGLGALMKHQPRVDPLVVELLGTIKSSDDDVAPSVVTALAAVLSSGGKNVGAQPKTLVVEMVEEAFAARKPETYSVAVGKVVAALAKIEAASIRSIVDDFLAAQTPPTSIVSHIILAVMEEAPDAFVELEATEGVIAKVRASVSNDTSAIARPAREAREIMKEKGWEGA